MAITGSRPGRPRRHRVRLSALVLTAGLAACAGGVAPVDRSAGAGRRDAHEPVLSYAPTCTSKSEPGCLSGTEVQALETYRGKLYAGTTSWMETLANVWPGTSAQVNVLGRDGGTWRRTPDLPGSPRCAPGNAPWEQVNDLHAATFTRRATTTERLFAGVLANEDGACPGLQASVFTLGRSGTRWIDTGLAARLERLYGTTHTEVRYLESHRDGTTDCPTGRPCLFAFVGPRAGTIGPSVWRAVYDPANRACRVICWDAEPEVVMDGVQAPPAVRIVAASDGPSGLYFGTIAAGPRRCGAGAEGCNRAALMERVGPRAWKPAWLGPTVRSGGPDQVRGIAQWDYHDGTRSLWFVTNPVGAVHRIDTVAGTRSAPVAEQTLGELLEACDGRMLPYQLYVHARGRSTKHAQLLVASQSCGLTPRDSFARIFHRPVARDGAWEVLDLTTVTNVGTDRSNEAAVRWIERSPFDPRDVYFGTTDMNNTPGSLTARVYRLTPRFG